MSHLAHVAGRPLGALTLGSEVLWRDGAWARLETEAAA